MNAFWVVFALMMVSDWIRDVFDVPKATRIGMLAVGVSALVATVLLLRMLRNPDAGQNTDGPGADVEGRVRSLKVG